MDTNNNFDQSMVFMIEITTLYNNNLLFNDIKLLIEFILLSMHCETNLNNINYNIDILRNEFYNINNSFIKDIFFFDLLSHSTCKCKKHLTSTNYILYLDVDPNHSRFNGLSIENIIKDSKMDLICNKCKESKDLVFSKIQFNSSPKILIVVFKKKINGIKVYYKSQMSIVDNKGKNNTYELIGIIKNIENNENEFETFCNTSINKGIWYKYRGANKPEKLEKNALLDSLSIENNNVPFLLIYQKIEP